MFKSLTRGLSAAGHPAEVLTGSDGARIIILPHGGGRVLGLFAPGGQMLIPTYRRTEPRVFFGKIPRSDLSVADRLVRSTMRRPGEQKIGLQTLAVTGRAGYLYPAGARWALVVRNFGVDPAALYGDHPWDDPAAPGSAVQACNVSNERLGHFSEMEYHVPALGGGGGVQRSEDVSQVWAFRGPGLIIRKLAGLLLGA